ncbi:MAG: DUF1631 family protein [Gammaproteobacteria bacterium]
MSTHNKVTERRRFPRYEINLGAILAFDGPTPFAAEEQITLKCNIQDFCAHGLFLEIRQSLAELSQLLHKTGKVLFPLASDRGRKYAQVDAKVVRVGPQGVGVAFEHISESVFNALLRKSKSQTKTKASTDDDRRTRAEDAFTRDRFESAIKEILGDRLPVLMEVFFKCARTDLEEAARQTQHFREEAVFLDAISELRFFQAAIVNEFCGSLFQGMDFIRKLRSGHSLPRSEEEALSLVDKDDFEEWLSLSSCVKKVSAQFGESLSRLELKFCHITGIPRHDLNNPVSPDNLYHSFQQSISAIDGIGPLRQHLYKAFESALCQILPDIYQSIDTLLEEHGVTQQVVADLDRQGRREAKSSQDKPARQSPLQNSSAAEQKLPGRNGQGHFPALDRFASWSVVEAHKDRQVRPVALTARRLLDIIQQRHSAVEPSATGNRPVLADAEQYSIDEIVGAITRLQELKGSRDVPLLDSSGLHKQLGDILSASSHVVKRFSIADQNRLDIYGKLFDVLIHDLLPSPHVRSYLETIYIPMMALAVRDSDFLDSESHPARSVVNQLISLESAVKGNRIFGSQPVRQILDQLFDRIAQESTYNPEVFALVNDELTQIAQAINHTRDLNVRRLIDVYEGKQKLERARRIVQDEIDRRIAGKWIPAVISALLDSGWQHLLVITQLNEEADSPGRSGYLEVLDNLLNWLNHPGILDEEHSFRLRQELEFIDGQLASVCADAYLHGKVMDELRACLLGVGTPPVRRTAKKIFIEPGKAGAVAAVTENSWTRQVEQLQTGDWFSLLLEVEESEPVKLVWIGNEPKIYLFVNREGRKTLELGRHELAALMCTGSVSRIESLDEPPMDRAANRVLQKMYEQLVYDASHDQVTQLVNRREFLKLLKEELMSTGDYQHMLCYMEILDFRMIANICGSKAGDELLKNISHLVKNQLNQNILFARLGDKIFGILIKHCSEQEGYEIARTLREHINRSHFEWEDKSYSIGVSIGLVPFYEHGYNADELLQQADSASIMAKRSGNNRIRLYKDDDAGIKAQADIHHWAGRIDQIFSDNRLFVRCQKISAIHPERSAHTHYEILLGLTGESGAMIPPGSFLPAVEHCRRMPEIDRWVTDTVFNWIEQNRVFFDRIGGFAINLSGQSLNSEEFLDQLVSRMRSSSVPLDKITFEVTETVASDNLLFTGAFIRQIKQFGCKFSLDDFGTGYSSYAYLKNLNVDYLKIDGSFVKEIAASPTDVAMVRSMNEIAHSLGLETIAEYVENNEIYNVLKEIGVDYGQGWGIHKPVKLAELAV